MEGRTDSVPVSDLLRFLAYWHGLSIRCFSFRCKSLTAARFSSWLSCKLAARIDVWASLCFQFAAHLKFFLNVEPSENAGMCFSPHFLLGFEIQAFGTVTLSNTFVKYLPSKGWFDVREIQRAFSVKPYFLEIRKVAFPIVTRHGSRRTGLLRENYDSRYL